MADGIFSKIVRGELPSYKVYEDDLTYAFLDIHPVQPGHTLVIPKKEIDHLWDLPDADYLAVMAATKKVANKLREVLKPTRVGMKVMGHEVPHAHVQLIPFNDPEEFHIRYSQEDPSSTELTEMAAKLAF